ncbi:MAG: tetratricopeptide repeat protein [Nitrospinae bacterium]|nr:tetratricopeptide repeat protein [Nitrospinota bacterium]
MSDKKHTVALIEDEFIRAHPIKRKFMEEGFAAETFPYALESLDKIAAMAPDIIVLDCDPGHKTDPYYLAEKIRADDRLKGAEVFFYTQAIDVQTEIMLRKLKITSYFTKTEKIEYLVDAAQQHFVNLEAEKDKGRWEDQISSLDVPERENDVQSPDTPAGEGFESTHEFSSILSEFGAGLERHLAKDENYHETRYNLGVSYYEMELYDKALEELTISLQSPDFYFKSLNMMGMAHRRLGETEKAIENFKKGYQEAKEEFVKLGFLYEIGDTYDAVGKHQDAYRMFAAVYKQNKEFKDVRSRLITLKNLLEPKNP